MHLSKLIKTLKQFDKPTMKRMSEYFHSSCFKTPAAMVQLFDYMQQQHPVFEERLMQPEAIKAAGDALRNAKTQSNVANLLLKQVDLFMAIENLQHSKNALRFHALHQYKQQRLTRPYSDLWPQAMDESFDSRAGIHEVYWHRHLFTELQYSGLDARLKREENNDLSPLAESLDVFYALKKLFFLTEMQLRHAQFGTPQPAAAPAQLLETLKPFTAKKHPQVFLTVQAYQMVSAESFETGLRYFEALQRATNNTILARTDATLARAVRVAHRWCVYWFNRGIQQAAEHYLWCIDFKMKNNLLLQDEAIEPTLFGNTLIVAMQAQKPVAWVKQFMEQYSPLLPGPQRETSMAFGNALLCYMQQKYKQAIRHYRQAQAKDDAIFNALMRRWEFVALYEDPESSEEEQLNHLEAFKKFLLRNEKRLPHVKPGFDSFIRYSRELLLRHPAEKYAALYAQLNTAPHFPGKAWLSTHLQQKTKARARSTG